MRAFPFSPRSTSDLEIGDFWTLPLPSGGLGVVQVRDLQRTGRCANGLCRGLGGLERRLSAIARLTSRDDVSLLRLDSDRALTEGGAQIIGHAADTAPIAGLTSTFRDVAVGTRTQTWGWKVLANRVEKVPTSSE